MSHNTPRSQTMPIETEHLKITLDQRGYQIGLIDKSSGKNYLRTIAPLWKVIIKGKEQACSHVVLERGKLTVDFGGKGIAEFRLKVKKDYFILELAACHPAITQISMMELGLKKLKTIAKTINAAYDEDFAFCVMALSLPVDCGPAESTLKATCYDKYGLAGNKIAVIGCPSSRLKEMIQKVEKAERLPHIRLDGAWGKTSPTIKRSYLFLHDLGEENCDRAIDYAKRMKVGMIMILETWASRTMGHFPINRELFPHGEKGLKSVVARIHKAGLKAGLHFLSTGVSSNDRYVTPVPDKRLFKDASAVLACDIDSKQATIPCLNATAGFPASLHPQGIYFGNGVDIQIDDEIISYGAVSKKKVCQFSDCHRGAYGTKPTKHRQGAAIHHLMRSYSYFVTDLASSITDEIAGRIAAVIEDCGFDMMYFDGAERLQGDHWYYNPQLLLAFYHKISPHRRDKMHFQGSSHAHFSWHMVSRSACADGYANIKDNVNHASTLYPTYFDNFMPVDIGWYGIGQKEISYSDIEYVLAKSIGWNSSVGFSTSMRALELNHETSALLEMAGKYEELRLKNYFPEAVKKVLRQYRPCHLLSLPGGKLGFAAQEEKTISTMDGVDNTLSISSSARKRMLEVQITVGDVTQPGAIYQSKESVEIIDFKADKMVKFDQTMGLRPFGENVHAIKKTTAAFTHSVENTTHGSGCGILTAKSRLADRSGWTGFCHHYHKAPKLDRMQGVGVWVRADGKGAVLKPRLRDITGCWLDYNVKLDFQGWRYLELAITDDIVNPDYQGKIDKSKIAAIFFFLTRLPPNVETTCRVAGLKALPSLEKGECVHPSITVEKQTIALPVNLKQGDFLTCSANGKCAIIDRHGKKRVLRPSGELPVLKKGKNIVRFQCENDLSNEVRIRVSQGGVGPQPNLNRAM